MAGSTQHGSEIVDLTCEKKSPSWRASYSFKPVQKFSNTTPKSSRAIYLELDDDGGLKEAPSTLYSHKKGRSTLDLTSQIRKGNDFNSSSPSFLQIPKTSSSVRHHTHSTTSHTDPPSKLATYQSPFSENTELPSGQTLIAPTAPMGQPASQASSTAATTLVDSAHQPSLSPEIDDFTIGRGAVHKYQSGNKSIQEPTCSRTFSTRPSLLACEQIEKADTTLHETANDSSDTAEDGLSSAQVAYLVKNAPCVGQYEKFHCPICINGFTRLETARDHFDGCVEKRGNPHGKVWDDHESCQLLSTGKRRCPLCDKEFHRTDILKRHLELGSCPGMKDKAPALLRHDSATKLSQTIPCPICSIKQPLDLAGEHIVKCRQEPARTQATNGRSSVITSKPNIRTPTKSVPIDVFAKSTPHHDKRAKAHRDQPNIGDSVLKLGRKRSLQDIPLDTLFDPKQVVSENQYEKMSQRKRQKVDKISKNVIPRMDMLGNAEGDSFMGMDVFHDAQMDVDRHDESSNTQYTYNNGAEKALSTSNTSVEQADHDSSAVALDNDTIKEQQATRLMEPSLAEGTSTLALDDIQPLDSSFRPTTGGKHITEADLATHLANTREQSESKTEVPDTAYQYWVNIMNWGMGLAEEKAAQKIFGPYFSLEEANLVAAHEVQLPITSYKSAVNIELEGSEENKIQNPGWSYGYEEDKDDMQTHTMIIKGMHAKAIVQRGTTPRVGDAAISKPLITADISTNPKNPPIPISAFRTPPTIYSVNTLVRYHPSPADDLFGDDTDKQNLADCEFTQLDCFTVPDLAHKLAANYYTGLATRGMSASDTNEVKMEIRKEIRELQAEGWVELFRKSTETEEPAEEEGGECRKGVCLIWVEKVGVKGPRN